jgi:hypothetical protein
MALQAIPISIPTLPTRDYQGFVGRLGIRWNIGLTN